MSESPSPPSGAPPPTDCFFCALAHSGRAPGPQRVYEDPWFLVSHSLDDTGTTYLGSLIVQTKRHVPDLSGLTREEAAALGPLLVSLSGALKESTGASWTYCYSFLEGVRHVHFFVVARYASVPPEYVRLAIADWPKAPQGDLSEVTALVERIRARMRA
jgi:histidine triad (HIT) family protein